jgi:hypothetical protein
MIKDCFGSEAGNGEACLPSPQLPSGEFQTTASALFGTTHNKRNYDA